MCREESEILTYKKVAIRVIETSKKIKITEICSTSCKNKEGKGSTPSERKLLNEKHILRLHVHAGAGLSLIFQVQYRSKEVTTVASCFSQDVSCFLQDTSHECAVNVHVCTIQMLLVWCI